MCEINRAKGVGISLCKIMGDVLGCCVVQLCTQEPSLIATCRDFSLCFQVWDECIARCWRLWDG